MAVLIGLLFGLAAPSAWALDCAKPHMAGEKTVCADAKLKAAHDAMAASYQSLHAVLDDRQRELLAGSQQKWLLGNYVYPQVRLATIDDRRKFLAPAPRRGTGVTSRLVPFFIQQKGDRRNFVVNYELVRFLEPGSPGEVRFNAEIDRLVAELPLGPRQDAESPDNFLHEFHGRATVLAVSPRVLLAVVVTGETNWLASSTNVESWSILIDLERGVLIEADDLFDPPARAALRDACLKQVLAQRKKKLEEAAVYIRAERLRPIRDAIERRHKDMARLIDRQMRDIRAWSFGKDKAALSVGGISGYDWDDAHGCSFAMADIRKLARPDALLPE